MRRTLAVILALLTCWSLGAGPAGADTPDAPVLNDWDCRPSAAHPRPVVLVHGTAGAPEDWQTIIPLLADQGYCVFALTYGTVEVVPGVPLNALGSIEDSAAELATFVAQVRRETGAKKVDLVGHSQGTMMPDYYARFLGGGTSVQNYVSLAPLWHGTLALMPVQLLTSLLGLPDGALLNCPACGQMAPGSAFMEKMRGGTGVKVPGITYTNIMTRYDEAVLPYTSGFEPGMTNVVLQDVCPLDFSEHGRLPRSPNVGQLVLNALDPAHATSVRCQLVLPLS
ncbi:MULTISPECIES: esterase/lipase family protein [unclassified Nocardioides]|uniref:esterase/lipase family protein n=1 Tax=unclassified Nocardioides TaxID=2615069 RepID=UPI0006FB7752|nr:MULTISPECIES: alpha/beta fold hydrolase [unclassified Nocardioides]KRA38717.1 hypothetical protein ASD81_08970 [Nocardioides sp. Root614]KRA92677.1 hypothetical protein ASD84_09235 [Nocardioides sp. Root682]